MDGLGIYWNKDKVTYSAYVQAIVHLDESFYYVNEVCLDYHKEYRRVGKFKKPQRPYKQVAPKELAGW